MAADRQLTEVLLESHTTAIAYETVQTAEGKLPLLMPMSEVARAHGDADRRGVFEKHRGGTRRAAGRRAGRAAGGCDHLGGGTVGGNGKVALGMGAQVTVLDIHHDRLQYLDDIFLGRLQARQQ